MRANFIENRLLNDIAERDGLSGLYNRRMFDNLTNRLWLQAQRNQRSAANHSRRHRPLQGVQRSLRPPGRRQLHSARRRDHRARAQAAVRLLRALRRRGIRARALRSVGHRSDCAARADSPRHDGARYSARASDAAGMITVSIGSATAQPETQAQPRRPDPSRRRSALPREATGPQSRAARRLGRLRDADRRLQGLRHQIAAALASDAA